jgi:hypothetical protein
MNDEELENRKQEKKQIMKFFALVVSLFIGLMLTIFIYYNIHMYFMDKNERHHIAMSQKFQMLYTKDRNQYFDAIQVVKTEESINIKDSNDKPELAIKLLLDKGYAKKHTDWKIKDIREYLLSATIHDSDSIKEFSHTKEIYITKEDYPFYKEGWHISGKYICLNDSNIENLLKLNCIQVTKKTFFDEDKKTLSTNFVEFY